MEQFDNHELEYMLQDYNDANFDDEYLSPEEDVVVVDGDMDSDFDDDFELSKSKNDTSALEAKNGKDIQGIPWERFNLTRDMYRDSRLKQYKNYESLSQSRESLAKECKSVETGHGFYDFQFNTRLVKSTIVHFQIIRWTSIMQFYKFMRLYLECTISNSRFATASSYRVLCKQL